MSDKTPSISAECSTHRGSRIFELAIGHTVNTVLFVYGFDYVLYPFVIWKLGLVTGGGVMAILSLIACLLTLWFYNWSKRDWLGIEQLKQVRDFEGATGWRRKLAEIVKRGDWVALIVLSWYSDPFITVVWMRHGSINRMTARDYKILLGSWLITSTYWALVCFGGVNVLEKIWKILTRG